MKRFLKKFFPNVSWQHPLINFIFKLMDPFDYLVRILRGLGQLPKYSIRVRSNGVTKQFGGRKFKELGTLLANHLQKKAGVHPDASVLEIGCGCGRTAFALSDVLNDGNFTGMDIDKPSLDACLNNNLFKKKKFHFDYLDIQNDEYNPEGKYPADSYVFPYGDQSFDTIFLVSVFTHMKSDDVRNYIKEISRLLKPGGVCLITCFIMDKGTNWTTMNFHSRQDEHFYFHPELPEIAIGYESRFLCEEFEKYNVRLSLKEWGSWRDAPETIQSNTGFSQDFMFFKKNQ